jgi:murein DD-endopeptidase MepM/ murein hydrolase activator NlpD
MSRLNRFLNGKGFYVALGICMIAVGVSAFAAIDKVGTAPSTAESSNVAQKVEDGSSGDTEANKEITNIPDEREESTLNISSESEQVTSVESAVKPVAKYFVFPVVGEVIKKFSSTELQYSVTFNDMRLHTGIDIKADEGSAVNSAGEGVVTEILNDENLGYTVKVDHGNGIIGVYAGLAKSVAVEENEYIASGTNLGALGTVNNECLDAAHLHLEFYKDGVAVDPLEYLEK